MGKFNPFDDILEAIIPKPKEQKVEDFQIPETDEDIRQLAATASDPDAVNAARQRLAEATGRRNRGSLVIPLQTGLQL